jgi:hypothetical protein
MLPSSRILRRREPCRKKRPISAMASDMPSVVIGRLVQGLGGGFLMSLCYFAMDEEAATHGRVAE